MSIRTFIFSIILLLIILYFLNFNERFNSKCNYNDLKLIYTPNYKEKYDELLSNYELINENYTFIPAQITNPLNMKIHKIFYLNKGSKDKVLNNSFIVNEEGLVGIVKKVFDNYSVAELISSSKTNIPVEINECYGTLNKGFISDLINCDDVNINDPIFSSKYSKSSSNILIGYVKKIDKNKIYVRYSVNPYKLKYFGIIYDEY